MQRVVARYGACLSGLPGRQRRVLRLRAGVGPRDPASRATVARRLEMPVARVRRAERRGLRALVRAGRAGCAGGASDGDPAAPGLLGAGLAAGAGSGGGAVLVAGTGTGGAGAGSGGGGSGSGTGDDPAGDDPAGGGSPAGGVKGITATGGARNPDETGFVLPALGVLLVIACFAGFGLETRRVWRSRTDVGA